MAQSDDGNLLNALQVLPNAHLVIANELKDMAACYEPYEHFSSLPETTRKIWAIAADMLAEIGGKANEQG